MDTTGAEAAFYNRERMRYAHNPRTADDGEFMVGYYEKGAGSEGEFAITLHRLGPSYKLYPRLEVFHDGISAMQLMEEEFSLISKLSTRGDLGFDTTNEFAAFLVSNVGLKDYSDFPQEED